MATRPGSTFWKSKEVLVTGGASFIGSHLVEQLVAFGAKVRVADDFSSGKREHLESVVDRIEVLEADLRDPAFAARAVAGIDVVFHLAANHGGRGYIHTHPVECATNFILDGVVFAAAHAAGVDRVCFASSACVYPSQLQEERRDGNKIFLKEDDAMPFEPGKANADLEYGWAKFMGEMTLAAYHREYGLKSVSCRLFTAYGERENETHAVIALVAKAFAEMDPYEIWGTGQQDRNFTYVGDIVEGLMLACEKITDGSAVNLGTAEHIAINDAAKEIFAVTGFTPKTVEHDLSKPTGVFSRAADLARSRKLLGWEPQTAFKDGIKKTIDWYAAHREKEFVKKNLEMLLNER